MLNEIVNCFENLFQKISILNREVIVNVSNIVIYSKLHILNVDALTLINDTIKDVLFIMTVDFIYK